MATTTPKREYAVARKGTTVVISQRADMNSPWRTVGKHKYGSVEKAKEVRKKKLDEMIARFPDNKVRTGEV